MNGDLGDVLVEGPIDFDATLYDLKLRRRSDGLACGVPIFGVSEKLTVEALRSGHVLVDLDLPLLLVFKVETSSGERVPRALLSIIQPATEATWEITANEAGELKMLARPGLYSVMATTGEHSRGRDGASATFDVAPDERGERLIVLRFSKDSRF